MRRDGKPVISAGRRVSTEVLTEWPPCDVLLVTLRAEDLSDEMWQRLGALGAAVVVLSPIFSERAASAMRAHPTCFAATPSLVADLQTATGEHVEASAELRVEYWIPPFSTTKLDRAAQGDARVREFVGCLNQGGIKTRFAKALLGRSRSATLTFFPLQQAFAQSPHLSDWNWSWLRRVSRAFRVSFEAGRRVGPRDFPLSVAAWSLRWPLVLWIARALLQSGIPGLAGFLEHHFGSKLQAQTRMFAESLKHDADRLGLDRVALEQLLLQTP
jgi:hypothetical protein